MIDTSKYDGHTPGTWTVDPGFDNSPDYTDIREKDGPTIIASIVLNDSHWDLELQNEMSANARLIADAPLLLEEVKRLYEMMDVLASFHIVKNVEQGFTQREWVELVELAKRGEEE